MSKMQLEKSKVEVFAAGRLVESFRSEKELLAIAPARICEWDAMARKHASDAVRLALGTGALLLEVKSRLPHGAFLAWLSTSCGSVSQSTAYKYMALAEAAQRECRAIEEDVGSPDRLIVESSDGSTGDGGRSDGTTGDVMSIDERSLSQLYLDYGIVRRPQKWGGSRPNSGRPPKGSPTVEEELDEIANAEGLLWAQARDAIGTLSRLDGEKDVFRRLDGEHLAAAAGTLADLSRKAGEALKSRLAEMEVAK